MLEIQRELLKIIRAYVANESWRKPEVISPKLDWSWKVYARKPRQPFSRKSPDFISSTKIAAGRTAPHLTEVWKDDGANGPLVRLVSVKAGGCWKEWSDTLYVRMLWLSVWLLRSPGSVEVANFHAVQWNASRSAFAVTSCDYSFKFKSLPPTNVTHASAVQPLPRPETQHSHSQSVFKRSCRFREWKSQIKHHTSLVACAPADAHLLLKLDLADLSVLTRHSYLLSDFLLRCCPDASRSVSSSGYLIDPPTCSGWPFGETLLPK